MRKTRVAGLAAVAALALGAARAGAEILPESGPLPKVTMERLVLIAMGLLSLWTTRRSVRERNEFTWAPILEVAYLFAGIFVTMIPVLDILKARTHGALAFVVEAVPEPAHYFWVTGALSSFLDNAPTYLVFRNTALGKFSPGVAEREAIGLLIRDNNLYLEAIAAGAVFMGANSYIGNAPNFMVRSIAEDAGVEMPSFFGYILKYALTILIPAFVVVTWVFFRSTDRGYFAEESPLSPSSPYSASKPAADLLCLAYFKTHHLSAIVTRCTNNFGPYQFPEKLIPLAVTNALENRPIPVYGDGLNVRDWIFVDDHCRALDIVIQRGRPGQIYNVGGGNEKTNLELIHKLLEILGKPRSLMQFVTDRPAHDRRYAVDCTKISAELGWKPAHSFDKALKITVDWYLNNESWWRSIKSGEYAKYYEKMYSHR